MYIYASVLDKKPLKAQELNTYSTFKQIIGTLPFQKANLYLLTANVFLCTQRFTQHILLITQHNLKS